MKKLWNDKGILDVSAVDQSEFRVASQDGLTLVCPKKNKWDWTNEEKWLRSVVVDDHGRVVSCGWPKFGNYSEFQADTRLLDKALKENLPVRFTHKEDGSLCIRSAIGGTPTGGADRVILRTRGTLFGGDPPEDGGLSFGDRFAKVAERKYPQLLDPHWFNMPMSFLFEYVSPDNRIVVGYQEEDLIFLGMIHHIDFPFIVAWEEASEVAKAEGFHIVDLKEMPRNPLHLLDEVQGWRTEGVVARCPDVNGNEDRVMVKIKSEWYRENHRMKFSMTYTVVAGWVATEGVSSEEQLVEMLRAQDYDFEIIESAKELYTRCVAASALADEWIADARRLCDEFEADEVMEKLKDVPKLRKKEFAMIACGQREPAVKTAMFSMYDGHNEKVEALKQRIIMSEGYARK